MTIERQKLLMGGGVFFNARVLVIDILVETISPHGQRLLNALPIFPIDQPVVPEVKKRPVKLTTGRRKSIRAKGRGP